MDHTTRLLNASIAREENKHLRSEFNITQDLALQIVDLKKELQKAQELLRPFNELAAEVLYNSTWKDETVVYFNKKEITRTDLQAVSDYFMNKAFK